MEWLSFYITLFLLSWCHPLSWASHDRLMHGDTLSINQTLISADRTFALGFFSLGNSTTAKFYLGIWYIIPEKIIVWVANRESPLTDSSGVLKFSNDSNLIIMDSKGSALWTSDVSGAVSSRGTSAAVLLNSGNLVIRHDGDTDLWQSFDHPTDALLAGMKLKADTIFVSWKSAFDPSTGRFSLGSDPSTHQQFFIWQGKEPYWRGSLWTGDEYKERAWGNVSYTVELPVMPNGDPLYLMLSTSDGSAGIRSKLEPNGHVEFFVLDKSAKKWVPIVEIPNSKCETYGLCGTNGYCDMGDVKCKCLAGFEPKVWSDWSNGNFSGGCTRQKALNCGSGDEFSKFTHMKLPDKFMLLRNLSIRECEAKCSSNCSCTAYASYVSGETNNISRCLIWTGDLIDLSQYDDYRGADLYVRLVPLERDGKGNIRMVVIVASVLGVIILLTCIFIVCKPKELFKGLRKKLWNKWMLLYGFNLDMDIQKELSSSDELGEGKVGELPLFDLGCLIAATHNFSNSNELGQGGFGKVYKGKLPDGQEIAVKRLSKASGQGSSEFKNEFTMISKLQHKNLVRLLGCCIELEERILVYELMPNKSLDFFLFDLTKQVQLDWGKRFNIIKGISRGLLYLHHDSRLRIIHRDLKASNILLDEDMNPKISDFGMARIVGGNQNQANTNRIVGTYGYMSPEYAMEGLFSLKSDVYGFGVLVLEIVSGCKNSSFHDPLNFSNLLHYAWNLWNEGKVMEFMDPSIVDSCSTQEVSRCIHIGLLCVQDRPNDRPSMSSVVLMLESENMTFPTPKQPIFTIERIPDEGDIPLHNISVFSINEMTITMEGGR